LPSRVVLVRSVFEVAEDAEYLRTEAWEGLWSRWGVRGLGVPRGSVVVPSLCGAMVRVAHRLAVGHSAGRCRSAYPVVLR
jgi:hypothetical protein